MSERRFTRAIAYRLRRLDEPAEGKRSFSVSVTQDAGRIAEAAPGVAAPATVRQCLDVYVSAISQGIPRSLGHADRTLAAIEHESARNQSGMLVSTLVVGLPDLSRAALRPLGSILQSVSERSAMTGIAIEELGIAQLETFLLSDMPDFAKGEWPFSFKRARGRDRYDMASVVVRFARDPSPATAERLERWGRAWASLLEWGAFEHSDPDRAHCSGYLRDVVDAYADEWVFHFEQLALTDEACFPLLERLAELAATDPIQSVEIA